MKLLSAGNEFEKNKLKQKVVRIEGTKYYSKSIVTGTTMNPKVKFQIKVNYTHSSFFVAILAAL